MSQPAPGFQQHPDYRLDIAPASDHIRILAGDTCIADSRLALLVTEPRHHPVWYLPLNDVDAALIEATDHSTYCPFKGHASYWTIRTAEQRLENSIWGYLTPYRECEGLLGHVAFYTDRLTLEINGEVRQDSGPGWTK